MSAKHTPGPWKVQDNGATVISEVGNAWNSALLIRLSGENIDANAHLIAAAPELLAALEETLDALAYRLADSARSPVVQRARAALAKARGES